LQQRLQSPGIAGAGSLKKIRNEEGFSSHEHEL
jgi:hypothetical protein